MELIGRQEQDRRDLYRRNSRIGRRRNEREYHRNRGNNNDTPDWARDVIRWLSSFQFSLAHTQY